MSNPFDSSTWSDNDRLYYNSILDLADSKEDRDISNSEPAHAVFLINTLLSKAQKSFWVLSGNLKRVSDDYDVSGNRIRQSSSNELPPLPLYESKHLLMSFLGALHRGVDIRVIIEKDLDGGDIDTHPLVATARMAQQNSMISNQGGFDIRRLSPKIAKLLKEDGDDRLGFNYAVQDGCAYRYEYEPSEAKAVANFGDKGIAKGLQDLFEGLWKQSDSILIPKT